MSAIRPTLPSKLSSSAFTSSLASRFREITLSTTFIQLERIYLQDLLSIRGGAVPETRMRLPPRSNLSSSLSAVLPASLSEKVTKPEPADLPVIGSEKKLTTKYADIC